MAESTRGDRLNRNITLICLLGVKNLAPDFFMLEEGNPHSEVVMLLLPSSSAVRNHPHPPAAASPCQVLRDYKQELFDQWMGWFLTPNLLGLLTPYISCLFRVHVLCSLKPSFPDTTLWTFFEGSCDSAMPAGTSKRTTEHSISCSMDWSGTNSVSSWIFSKIFCLALKSIFMPHLSVAGHHRRWRILVFRHVLRQIESEHWEMKSLLAGDNPSQSTDLHLRGHRHIHNPGSAGCAAPMGKCMNNYKESE